MSLLSDPVVRLYETFAMHSHVVRIPSLSFFDGWKYRARSKTVA